MCRADGGGSTATVQLANVGLSGTAGDVPFRSQMEQQFATNFGSVRAHMGTEARDACKAMGAKAYTLGNRIAFKDSKPDKGVVAHELTHVVQQRAVTPPIGVTMAGPANAAKAEAQAQQVEQAASGGRSVQMVMASSGGMPRVVQRSELHRDTTEVATVKAVGALRKTADPASASMGNLALKDAVRILEKPAGAYKVHVETGNLKGKIGYFSPAGLDIQAKPTSRLAAAYGHDMYTYCRNQAIANHRKRVLNGFLLMTHAQHQTVLKPGDPTWTAIKNSPAILPDDIINMLNVAGARLNRKLKDYLDEGGNTYDKLRLAFATATDAERKQVAQDDGLVGRVAPLLPKIHPEILFGPVVAGLYPASGKIADFETTNPNLGAWLKKFTGPNANIKTDAKKRFTGLAGTLAAYKAKPGQASFATMMKAVHAAPRGMALPAAERDTLDEIESLTYGDTKCSANDLAVMFVTRWGRDMKKGWTYPKSFIHQIWAALKQLPDAHTRLLNVVNYMTLETDPKYLGSFGYWMKKLDEHGGLFSKLPKDAGILHFAHTKRGKNHKIKEQAMDILKPRQDVEVTDASGAPVFAKIAWVNKDSRHIGLDKTVNVKENGEIKDRNHDWIHGGKAFRIKQKTVFYKQKADLTPDLANKHGDLLVGNLYTRSSNFIYTVGSKDYRLIYVYEGQFRSQYGYIHDDPAAQHSLGDTTISQEKFAWTVRHEMGHALDLQVDGFTTFDSVCTAQWTHYPGVDEWLAKVLPAGGLNAAAQTANHTFGPAPQVTDNFKNAAKTYASAVQAGKTKDAPALKAEKWLKGYLAAHPGVNNLVDTVTQYYGYSHYYDKLLPALGGKVYTAQYSQYFHFNEPARKDSLAVGVPPYAYCCPLEFFAEHYASYTGPGVPPEKYARAVPAWAMNYFDRIVGRPGAGPKLGPKA